MAGAFAKGDTVYATAVVGPDQHRRSGGQTAIAWRPEEHSDVFVTTVLTIFSVSDRLVWKCTPAGGPVCPIAETWREPSPHLQRRQLTSSMTVANMAHEAPVFRSAQAESTEGFRAEPLRSEWMVLSTAGHRRRR